MVVIQHCISKNLLETGSFLGIPFLPNKKEKDLCDLIAQEATDAILDNEVMDLITKWKRSIEERGLDDVLKYYPVPEPSNESDRPGQ